MATVEPRLATPLMLRCNSVFEQELFLSFSFTAVSLLSPLGGLLISSTLEGGLLERGRLINFLKFSIAKYLLFENSENRKNYSCCLVCTSLAHSRAHEIEKLCSNR